MPLDEPVCVFEETPRDGSGQSKEDTSGKSKEYPDDTSSVCNEDDHIRKCQRQMDRKLSPDEEPSLSMPFGLTRFVSHHAFEISPGPALVVGRTVPAPFSVAAATFPLLL